ncbi:MAG TPA: chain length determinant protein tyrosine kinase EpsG [Usitatibacter sp.]|nr:chain length determinant protein tyrosine kinase EpsG [Usitatibacter sp.]
MSIQENVVPFEAQRATILRSDRLIGAILVEDGKLTASEVENVLELQRSQGMRFGEAAVRLGYITDNDVRFALAKQYDFPHLVQDIQAKGHQPSTELVAAFAPFHPRTEELRALRTQLLIRWYNPQANHNSLVIVSPDSGEGRSYLAANLAVVFSQLGARTLLIDADMRTPRQHQIFGLPPGLGLSMLLAGRGVEQHKGAFPIHGLNRLSVLPAGPLPPNPQELLSRPAFSTLMKDMQSLYDVVIIDTPPARKYADAQSIAYRAGDALMVVRKDHTTVAATSKVLKELAGTGARVVGTTINAY